MVVTTSNYLQVFKKLFEEGLKTQRDRIRDLRQYSRDQREERSQKQRDELTSIENLYPFKMGKACVHTEWGKLLPV